jgi:hypothetical protein
MNEAAREMTRAAKDIHVALSKDQVTIKSPLPQANEPESIKLLRRRNEIERRFKEAGRTPSQIAKALEKVK